MEEKIFTKKAIKNLMVVFVFSLICLILLLQKI